MDRRQVSNIPRRSLAVSSRLLLVTVLSLYLLLALAYGILNPLFEAPDEHWHYFTAQYIADTGRLPYVGETYDEWLSQEAAQPPLYYLLSALIILPIDTAGAREQVWLNPFVGIGDASVLTNVNRFVHTPAEAWPWQGYALAAHLLRGFSALLGLATLACIYGSGRLLWPAHPQRALLAMTLVAFLPQFGFVHGAISNDTLITFLCAAAIWQLLYLWLIGANRHRLLLLGVTIGLAALAKNAGILLFVYSLGVLFLLALRHGRRQLLAETIVLVVAPVFLIAGWLWWRNWSLYGDITATEPFIRIAGGDRGYTLWQALTETGGLWTSLLVVFGWFNLRAPVWLYWLWYGLGLGAIAGLLREIRDWRLGTVFNLHQRWFTAVLLALWFGAVYAGLLLFMLRTEAAQGRLLFPALAPLALGLAYGLSRWRWSGVYWLAPLLALATSLYALLFVIRPAYALPDTILALPAEATPLALDMGQGLQLTGAHIEAETVRPGDVLWMTLYWQAINIPDEPPEFKLSLLGRDLAEIGRVHSYHGRGLYPACLWPAGAIIADRFAVRLDEAVTAPVLARVFVNVVGGQPGVAVGAVKVAPAAWPGPAGPALAQVGEGIELTFARLNAATTSPGEPVQLAVQWRVTAAPGEPFSTLVHLAEFGQPPLAQGDRTPLNGDYPTSVWAAGEVIDDSYSLSIPADLPGGRYPIWIGMYDPATLTRLPVSVEGQRQPGDLYLVGWIEVGK